MQLKLIGPLRIHPNNSDSTFHSLDALKIGVYVYAVKVKNVGYLTTYVGETGVSFLKRIKDHVINTLGSYERIYDPDALQEGKKFCFGMECEKHHVRTVLGSLLIVILSLLQLLASMCVSSKYFYFL